MLGHVDQLADGDKIPFLSDELVTLVSATSKFKQGFERTRTNAASSSADVGSVSDVPACEYPDFSEMFDEVETIDSSQESTVQVMKWNCTCLKCVVTSQVSSHEEQTRASADKKRASSHDDASDDSEAARNAPVEPPGIGAQKVSTATDKATLARKRKKTGFAANLRRPAAAKPAAKPSAKPAAKAVAKPVGKRLKLSAKTKVADTASSEAAVPSEHDASGDPMPPAPPSDDDGDLVPPFQLIRRHPSSNRAGECYILQAPGPSKRYHLWL